MKIKALFTDPNLRLNYDTVGQRSTSLVWIGNDQQFGKLKNGWFWSDVALFVQIAQ
ncbi:MAG: hypothetical protein ACK4SA_05395 [Caldilinea sp.]